MIHDKNASGLGGLDGGLVTGVVRLISIIVFNEESIDFQKNVQGADASILQFMINF